MKYYIVYSSGVLKEVDKATYERGFDDPFATLLTSEAGELTIEKLTEETEDDPFYR